MESLQVKCVMTKDIGMTHEPSAQGALDRKVSRDDDEAANSAWIFKNCMTALPQRICTKIYQIITN